MYIEGQSNTMTNRIMTRRQNMLTSTTQKKIEQHESLYISTRRVTHVKNAVKCHERGWNCG